MPTRIDEAVFVAAIVEKFPALEAGLRADYARIGAFLTDELQVRAAMRTLDEALAECAVHWGEAGPQVRARRPSDAVRNKIRAEVGQPGPPADIPDESFIRTLHFGKTLREVEAMFGFVNKGRVFTGFVPDDTFREMVRDMETWKDSIAFDHGEYTHRLQWMAIAFHFNFPNARLKQLYTSSVPPGSERADFIESRGDPKPKTMWDFVVDCFSSVTADHYDPIPAVRTRIVSDGFRSPNVFTRYFRDCPDTPFISKYLHSSRAKLQLTADDKFEGLTAYRRRRTQQKYGVAMDKFDVVIDKQQSRVLRKVGDNSEWQNRDFADPPL